MAALADTKGFKFSAVCLHFDPPFMFFVSLAVVLMVAYARDWLGSTDVRNQLAYQTR